MSIPPKDVQGFLFLDEATSSSLITNKAAFDAVRDAFIAIAEGGGSINPVVIGKGPHDGDIYSLKSGVDAGRNIVGVKIGSYWPGNDAAGMARHGATTVLLNPETGRLKAVVSANAVNCYRTAAADAVAASALARSDAKTLTLFGAGHQAWYEATAVADVVPLEIIHVVSRSQEKGEVFCARLGQALPHCKVQQTSAQEAVESADIIVTATTAREPLFDAAWVSSGAHIASMGSDTKGKQELPPALFAKAKLFCDLPEQSSAIGEFQHYQGSTPPTAIGDVLQKTAQGRASNNDITIFDSSGIALQDLFVAAKLVEIFEKRQRLAARQDARG